MSTEALPVHAALAAVMADVAGVAKRDENTQHGFSFRGIDAILNAVGPVLRRHAVVVLPHVEEVREAVVEVGRNRTRMGHVTVLVTYTFIGPDGSTVSCRVPGEAMDAGDKAASKAMSVAFRTALIQALALPTDEPDPDGQSYERAAAPALMSSSQQTAIAEALAGLDDEARDELSSWWKGQGFPPLSSGRLTQEHATVVLAHLDP
jgi:hypothetical protein